MLVTLGLILVLEFFLNKKFAVRAMIAGMVLLAGMGFLVFKRQAPAVFEYRVSDPSNIYSRIAQQRQTLDLFLTHPIGGVGWGDYMDVAYDSSDVTYNGVTSAGSAHNTLGAILVETGLAGFLPFVVAQFLLLRAFWRLRRRGSRDARLASTIFLYVFLSYWITGVSLTSGYYSDVNMWYLLVTAVLYKFAVTEPPRPAFQPQRHSMESRTPVRWRPVPA
jgi:O-antigen ligase